MHDRTLHRMRDLIRSGQYVVTVHAHEEMEADDLTVYDLEHLVLTGRIFERQRDERTNEWKYMLVGDTIDTDRAGVICKIGPNGRLVIVTVFALGHGGSQ